MTKLIKPWWQGKKPVTCDRCIRYAGNQNSGAPNLNECWLEQFKGDVKRLTNGLGPTAAKVTAIKSQNYWSNNVEKKSLYMWYVHMVCWQPKVGSTQLDKYWSEQFTADEKIFQWTRTSCCQSYSSQMTKLIMPWWQGKEPVTCDVCTWYVGNQKLGAPNLINVDQNNLQLM